MVELLSVSSVTATFEIQNDHPYYSGVNYYILLNGQRAGSTDKNVFSLFSLEPDTEYSLSLQDGSGPVFSVIFRTAGETFALNVRDFGARGDGITEDTAAIQAAIAACPLKGRVYFPAGTYLSSPIFPKSNMTLELCEGAVLLGVRERNRYPLLPGRIEKNGQEYFAGSFEGEPALRYASLICLLFVENLIITGRGIIDGNAGPENWWSPPYDFAAKRPSLFYALQCGNITLEGLSLRNSPSWTIHPLFCNNSRFLSLFIKNPADSPNTDGLNPEFCEDVLIAGVHFSVGDDCIAIKAGKLVMGERGFGPAKNIMVRNNLMEFGHGAVVLGSEVGGGIREVFISKCIFRNTDRGLRIKSRRGRGKRSVIDKIRMSNVIMDRVKTPFVINMFYYCGPDGKSDYVQNKKALPVDHRTPAIGSIEIEDVVCKNTMTMAAIMYGLPERKIQRVVMKNVTIIMDDEGEIGLPAMMCGIDRVKRAGIRICNAEKIIFDHVAVKNCEGREFIMENVDDISVDETAPGVC
jgi:polygalacturonase